MPFHALLQRIRKLIPRAQDARFDEIELGLESGKLTAPMKPMSDAELARAIEDFLVTPSSENPMAALNDKFDNQ